MYFVLYWWMITERWYHVKRYIPPVCSLIWIDLISTLISDFWRAKASKSVPMQTWPKRSNRIWQQPVKISNYMSHKSNNFVCMGLLLTRFCLRKHCHSIAHTVLTDALLLQIHILFRVLCKTTHGLSKMRGPSVDMTQSLRVMDSFFLTMILWAKPLFGESSRSFLQPEIDLFFSRCEHHSTQLGGTRDHLFSYEVGTGLYDLEYLEALFDKDTEEIAQIEKLAHGDGFGPLVLCSTVWNSNTIKVHCRE